MMPLLGGRAILENRYVDYLDATLVINTWETVKANTGGAELWYIIVEQTNNGATVETLELEITLGGNTYTWTLTNAVSGTQYYCVLDPLTGAPNTALLATITTAGTTDPDQAVSLSGASFSARVRQTTDVDGVSAQIEVNIEYKEIVPA